MTPGWILIRTKVETLKRHIKALLPCIQLSPYFWFPSSTLLRFLTVRLSSVRGEPKIQAMLGSALLRLSYITKFFIKCNKDITLTLCIFMNRWSLRWFIFLLFDILYITCSIYKLYKSVIILNILKQYLSCDSRHKRMKSFLNCLYWFLYISSHVSLMQFSNLKIRESLKSFLLIVKSFYTLVSIWSTYDYNPRRCLFRHSMALEPEDRGKVISYFPTFCFNLGKYLITWHIIEK